MSNPSAIIILPVVVDDEIESPIVLQPEVTTRQKPRTVRNDEDYGVNDNDIDDRGDISPWFCYRLILASLLAIVVCYAGVVFSCRSFRYNDREDDIQYYYGFRGFNGNDGRCVDWQTQTEIQWNDDYWMEPPALYMMGIGGVALFVAITLLWMAYGLVLYSLREHRRRRRRGEQQQQQQQQPPPVDGSCATIIPVVVVGVLLIAVGFWFLVTIVGTCGNIPEFGNGCHLWMWSSLALIASIASCVIGCPLVFGVICFCRDGCCNGRWRGQLISY